MFKILICSKLFFPNDAIGAVRPSNFAINLNRFGNDVTVITDISEEIDPDALKGLKIIRVSNSPWVRKVQINLERYFKKKGEKRQIILSPSLNQSSRLNRSCPIFNKLWSEIKLTRVHLLFLAYELDWYFNAKKAVKKKLGNDRFDVVITSFGPISSVYIGKFIYRTKLAKYWISDLRDIMVGHINPFWLNFIYGRIEKGMVKKTDAITLVSKGQADLFVFKNKVNETTRNKVFVINNGFQGEIDPHLPQRRDKILRLAYTGFIYPGYGDLTMLFSVIDNLIREGTINPDHITFDYAGVSSLEMNRQASAFNNVVKIIKDYGSVNKLKSKAIQYQSDLLVILSWNNCNEQGVLTGKFAEYIQSYRPVISLTSGNLPRGELSSLVEKLNLGIACEYVTYERDFLRLKDYLTDQYQLVQEDLALCFNPNQNEMQKFNYTSLSVQLQEIINGLVFTS